MSYHGLPYIISNLTMWTISTLKDLRVGSGTHKRTYRIRSKVHSRIGSTQNSVYSIYFYNFQEKQELGLHEIGLKYQGLQPMSLTVISST